MKPTYFDLSVRDLGAARRFFETVLDWRFEPFAMPYPYYRIQAGPMAEPGKTLQALQRQATAAII